MAITFGIKKFQRWSIKYYEICNDNVLLTGFTVVVTILTNICDTVPDMAKTFENQDFIPVNRNDIAKET